MSELNYKKEKVTLLVDDKIVDEGMSFAKDYMTFLDGAKTEREAVKQAIIMAEKQGFSAYEIGDKLNVGDKKYYNNRGKGIFLFHVGSRPINDGILITAAHIDSPRLDLKQNPLFEADGLGFLKTHYYGGIRKYQWLTVPLALHGVICKKDGTVLSVNIGENDDDPIFYISDLLPHLAQADNSKPLGEAVKGERLNIMVGSTPIKGEDIDATVKTNILKYLNEKYGITERDFITSELCAVPALKARDVGFDRSMIAGYGHDDRCCAYPALTAFLNSTDSTYTTLCMLMDKEETGSDGVSGTQCQIVSDLMLEIANALGGKDTIVRAHSKCLSCDVSANFDPDHSDVFEKNNATMLGCGVTLCKFTGARGKSGTSDASAELMNQITSCLNDAGVVWQAAELGKVDAGGGGTVAKYMANRNIDTLDMGVGVTSMHSPYELIAKTDLYEAYRACLAFYHI